MTGSTNAENISIDIYRTLIWVEPKTKVTKALKAGLEPYFFSFPALSSVSLRPPFICASSNIFHHCSGKTEEMDRLTLSGRQRGEKSEPKTP